MLKFTGSFHLSVIVDRLVPEKNHILLETAYEAAIEFGGREELDFVRPEGQSYNPRPARVALILINDAGVTDSDSLAAAFLATTGGENLSFLKETRPEEFPEAVLELAQCALQPANALAAESSNEASKMQNIALALHLDRARHLHEAPVAHIDSISERFVNETKQLIEIASIGNEKMALLLKSWEERFSRQRKINSRRKQ